MSQPDQNRPDDANLSEPWQLEALALSIALQDAGLVTPAEWSEALGAEIEKARAAGDAADGSTYYCHVIAALEQLVDAKGLLMADLLAKRKREWEDAYQKTPHGQPVRLVAAPD